MRLSQSTLARAIQEAHRELKAWERTRQEIVTLWAELEVLEIDFNNPTSRAQVGVALNRLSALQRSAAGAHRRPLPNDLLTEVARAAQATAQDIQRTVMELSAMERDREEVQAAEEAAVAARREALRALKAELAAVD